ncbi:MAG TPA: cellulose synthase [Trebonia sp.]|jgi:hypothetical protein|nr:cellulose synthase [Trebonia sp.]
MNYDSFVWLPICVGLTAVGLVISYYYGRRHGRLSMMRGAAWSLLPLAAYLTGSIEMFWKIGLAIGHYADGFFFSPEKWAGIAVAGVAAVLFTSTHGKSRRRAARLARRAARAERKKTGGADDETGLAGSAGAAGALGQAGPTGTRALDTLTRTQPAKTQVQPAKTQPAAKGGKAPAKSAAADDDMKDIDEILRKRGI